MKWTFLLVLFGLALILAVPNLSGIQSHQGSVSAFNKMDPATECLAYYIINGDQHVCVLCGYPFSYVSPPGAAYNLRPINITKTTITMQWNIPLPLSENNGSTLLWWQGDNTSNEAGGCNIVHLPGTPTKNTISSMISGLLPNTTYGFVVLLNGTSVTGDFIRDVGYSYGGYSQIVFVTTSNSTQPPPPPNGCTATAVNATCIGQPYGLRLTNLSFSSASLEWNLPSVYLSNVTVWWGSICGDWSYSKSLGGALDTATISLTDNQTYCVSVMPWDGNVHGFLSNNLTITIGRPFNLVVLAQGNDWIKVSWANPYVSKIVNDTIYYGPTCGYTVGANNTIPVGWQGEYSTGGEATAFNLTKLKSGTTYCIAVQAWDGPSNLSNPVIDTTLGVASSGGGGGGGSSGGGGVGGIGSGTPIVLPGPNVCYSLPLVGCNWWLILAGLVIVVGGVQLYRGKRYGLLLIMGGIAIAILI